MINVELTHEEFSLVRMLLFREEASVRVETHHARGVFEYSEYLRSREKEIRKLLDKLEKVSPGKA